MRVFRATLGVIGELLVTGGVGWEGPADASFIAPALTWTVLTLTGFIGSAEPGIAAICWVWITPLVNWAGSGLLCGSILAGGMAAVAVASSEGFAEPAGRVAACAAIPGSEAAMAPLT